MKTVYGCWWVEQPCVYILPLRNENPVPAGTDAHLCRLYPTFKEWKLIPAWTPLKPASVYILPLRNENVKGARINNFTLFCLYPTFKEWKRRSGNHAGSVNSVVYILPLRNENSYSVFNNQCFTNYVYILPLRNENLISLDRARLSFGEFISYL